MAVTQLIPRAIGEAVEIARSSFRHGAAGPAPPLPDSDAELGADAEDELEEASIVQGALDETVVAIRGECRHVAEVQVFCSKTA